MTEPRPNLRVQRYRREHRFHYPKSSPWHYWPPSIDIIQEERRAEKFSDSNPGDSEIPAMPAFTRLRNRRLY
jgi:hypothetical protein